MSTVLLLLLACSGPDDTGGVPPPGEGLLLLCGGGTEGEVGEAEAWSVAYGALLARGDVTGDGRVRVAILSLSEETDWLPSYLVWLGADEAVNLRVETRAQADDPALEDSFAEIDAVFLKGGDQGAYYDEWNDTRLEAEILSVFHDRGGAVGGTSAGAMSASAWALAGGEDYISADVLEDSHTPYLDDASDGGSGIHDDFLGLLPGALVDTHVTARARLGRLAGAMARAVDEGAPADLLGIGLEEQTCLRVEDGQGRVSGIGSVTFLRGGDEAPLRVPGEPLVWGGLSLDRLTDGWTYDLAAGRVDTAVLPEGAEAVAWGGELDPQPPGDWSARGNALGDEEGFEWVVERAPEPWAVRPGSGDPRLMDAFGLMDAHDSDRRGANEEATFRTLHDHLGAVAFLVGDGGRLSRADGADQVFLSGGGRPLATLVLDAAAVTHRGLSPWPSGQDAGDGSLHAATLVGARLHVLYTDGSDGRAWSLSARAPTGD